MENATLILKTVDAFSDLRNTINTWNNINLRNLLGNMYDKYETFNLILTTVSTGLASSTLGNTPNDLNVSANISGLPFINQTYNAKTGNNESKSVLTSFQFSRSSNRTAYFSGNSFITFGKAQDLCNITISLTNISGGSLASGVDYPDVLYIFYVIGVPNQNDKLLTPPSRMDNNTGKIK